VEDRIPKRTATASSKDALSREVARNGEGIFNDDRLNKYISDAPTKKKKGVGIKLAFQGNCIQKSAACWESYTGHQAKKSNSIRMM